MAAKNSKAALEVLLAGVEIPLHRPRFSRTIAHVRLEMRA